MNPGGMDAKIRVKPVKSKLNDTVSMFDKRVTAQSSK